MRSEKKYQIIFPVWNGKKGEWEDRPLSYYLPEIADDEVLADDGVLIFDRETGYEDMMALAIAEIRRAVESEDRFSRVQWTGGGEVNHPMATFTIWDDDPDHYGRPEDRFFRIILKRV